MTQPLALLLYEKLLPGSQLVNRLQDLGYRVEAISDPRLLVNCAEQEKPLLAIVDVKSNLHNVSEAILQLKNNPATSHLPVVAFCPEDEVSAQTAAIQEGAALVVSEVAVMNHLKEILDRALQVE